MYHQLYIAIVSVSCLFMSATSASSKFQISGPSDIVLGPARISQALSIQIHFAPNLKKFSRCAVEIVDAAEITTDQDADEAIEQLPGLNIGGDATGSSCAAVHIPSFAPRMRFMTSNSNSKPTCPSNTSPIEKNGVTLCSTQWSIDLYNVDRIYCNKCVLRVKMLLSDDDVDSEYPLQMVAFMPVKITHLELNHDSMPGDSNSPKQQVLFHSYSE